MKLVLAIPAVLIAAVLLFWVPLLLVALVGFPYLVVLLALVVPWILVVLTLQVLLATRRVARLGRLATLDANSLGLGDRR